MGNQSFTANGIPGIHRDEDTSGAKKARLTGPQSAGPGAEAVPVDEPVEVLGVR